MSDGLITGTVNLALFGLIVLIRRLVHHEGLAAFGLKGDRRSSRLLLAGLAAGALIFSIYPVVAVALGVGRVFVAWTELPKTLVLLGCWGFGFGGVALFEEGLFRGYLLAKLRVKLPVAVAVAGQAVLFAAFHLITYAPSRYLWLGMLNVVGLAVVQAVLVLRTHSLMAAVGVHVSWDLIQTVLLMRQVRAVDTLLNLQVSEGIWAGTAFAPETGVIVSVAVIGLGVLVASTNVFSGPFRRRPSDTALEPPALA